MKNLKKKHLLLLAGGTLLLVLALALLLILPPIFSENARKAAIAEAESLAAELGESTVSPFLLYQSGQNTVAVSDGKSVGAFESQALAAAALLDNPETEADESAGFRTLPVEENEKLSALLPALPGTPTEETSGAKFTFADKCEANDSFASAPVTYEAWIRLPKEGVDRGGIILGNYGGGSFPCFGFEIFHNGTPRLYVDFAEGDGYTAHFTNVDVRTGEWLHLAIVNDIEEGEACCYVNGEFRQSLAAIPQIEESVPACIGGDNRQSNKQPFRGEIGSVAVYDRVRNIAEIKQDLKAYGEDGLMAAWDLSNVSEDRLVCDASGNGYTLSFPLVWFEGSAPEEFDYSFVAIGDTQMLNIYQPQNFSKLYDWIVDNQEAHKIKYVIGLGDITDVDRDDEWARGAEGYAKLDAANIPYALNIGNHDSDAKFDLTFDKEPYSSSFLGRYDDTLMNTYRKIRVGGINYLIFTLDFGARDDVLEWASRIIENNPDNNVIITTHAYLYPDGTTIDREDPYAPTNTDPKNNNGDDIWEKLVKKHENIVLVIGGHESTPYVVCTQTEGEHGNVVTQILSDHQDVDRDMHMAGQTATGMVTMLYFSDGGRRLTVNCYSTLHEMYFMPENQYTVTLDVVE